MFTYQALPSGQLSILKYTGNLERVDVPSQVEGRPVTSIADYAFCDTPITHLYLPDGITRLGRYALYRCFHLRHLSFTDSLTDLGAGAFTGCHHIEELGLTLLRGKTSILRDILLEVSEELTVTLSAPEGRALLLFPEFFEEGVENTPARIIEHHTHGSGMLYRNCFVHRELVFSQYDNRFPYALGQESEDFLIRLSLARLMYPMGLDEAHKKAYEAYLLDHFEAALDLFEKTRETDKVSYLMQWHRSQAKPIRHTGLDFTL